jgi:hypothetical protein
MYHCNSLNAIPDGLLDPIFTDIDDFSDFCNFDDTVVDKLQLDSGTCTSLKLYFSLKIAHHQCLLSQVVLKSTREDVKRQADMREEAETQ